MKLTKILYQSGKGAADPTTGEYPEMILRGLDTHKKVLKSAYDDEDLGLLDNISKVLGKGDGFLVLGGDHSSFATTAKSVHNFVGDDYVVIYFDAHLDAHNKDTSPTGNAHGMPVRTAIENKHVKAENMLFVGTRSYEMAELDFLSYAGANFVWDVNIELFLSKVHRMLKKSRNVLVSIDVDVLDGNVYKGSGYNIPGNINGDELICMIKEILRVIEKDNKSLIGVELVEGNHVKDINQKTNDVVIDLLDLLASES